MLEHGEHHHRDRRVESSHLLRGRQSVKDGHVHVQQSHVHDLSGTLAQRLAAVLGDGDHVDAVLPVEQPGKPFAHDYVVIGEQDADRCVHRRPSSSWIFGFGMAALMIHRPEREMKDNRPLSDSIRDFRFIRP